MTDDVKRKLDEIFAGADANDLAAQRLLEDDRWQARALVWLARRLLVVELKLDVDSSTPDPLEENEL